MTTPPQFDSKSYVEAMEAAMAKHLETDASVYVSALRQAFMAGVMFQLKYKPQENQT